MLPSCSPRFRLVTAGGLFLLALPGTALRAAAEARGDFWLDGALTLHLAATPEAAVSRQADPAVTTDPVIKTTGDTSVRIDFSPAKPAGPVVVLTPGPYRASWSLGRDWRLEFDCRHPGPATTATLAVIDDAGQFARHAPVSLPGNGAWHHFAIDFSALALPEDFDFSHVVRVALEFAAPRPERIWFDAVRFVRAHGGGEVALTDLPTTQRMADAVATRPARRDEAMLAMANPAEAARSFFPSPKRKGSKPDLARCFANLWLGRDLAEANRQLLALYSTKDPAVRAESGLEYTWDLQATPLLCRLYFNFGHAARRHPGRLTPEVERAILDTLWERTQFKNDIHAARGSTWALTGSENHDLNAKVGNVLASQIFQHEPAFAERVYPNLGSGLGYGYWFHQTPATGRFHGPEGTAPRDDPGRLHPRDHYLAWVAFMKRYLRERAARGFFLEKASPGYMRYSLSFLQDLYDYTEDAELRTLAGMFLDLVWAEWAQDEIAGARGGARTRDHGPLLDYQQDAMYQMATYLFGGPARYSTQLASFWLSDYQPPAVVWSLALNRAALGAFAYASRTPGEEPAIAPRPAGLERTLWCDTDSRLLRTSWVTPDYILGTQMDHPLAIHSHLSHAGRAQGMTFATSSRAMVFPRDVDVRPDGTWRMGADAMYRSLQQGPVLITQQSRGFTAVSPEWFPMLPADSKPYGVYFSSGLGRIVEERGWVFVEEGNAYLAVRVASGVYQVSVDANTGNKDWVDYEGSAALDEPLDPLPYSWSPDRTILRLKDRHSPIVFEAGRRADFPTLAAFKQHILGNALQLHKTTVPGWYRLTYVSGGHRFDFNAANNEVPSVDAQPIDYAPSRTFDSPWLQAGYRTGVVTITDGRTRLTLDFAQAERREGSGSTKP